MRRDHTPRTSTLVRQERTTDRCKGRALGRPPRQGPHHQKPGSRGASFPTASGRSLATELTPRPKPTGRPWSRAALPRAATGGRQHSRNGLSKVQLWAGLGPVTAGGHWGIPCLPSGEVCLEVAPSGGACSQTPGLKPQLNPTAWRQQGRGTREPGGSPPGSGSGPGRCHTSRPCDAGNAQVRGFESHLHHFCSSSLLVSLERQGKLGPSALGPVPHGGHLRGVPGSCL